MTFEEFLNSKFGPDFFYEIRNVLHDSIAYGGKLSKLIGEDPNKLFVDIEKFLGSYDIVLYSSDLMKHSDQVLRVTIRPMDGTFTVFVKWQEDFLPGLNGRPLSAIRMFLCSDCNFVTFF